MPEQQFGGLIGVAHSAVPVEPEDADSAVIETELRQPLRFLGRLAHRTARGDLERQRRRVDVVVRAVVQHDLEVDDREADEGARVPGESGEEGAEGEEGEASHQEVFFVELVSEFAGDDGGDGGGEHAGGNDPRVHGLGTV